MSLLVIHEIQSGYTGVTLYNDFRMVNSCSTVIKKDVKFSPKQIVIKQINRCRIVVPC